MIHVVITVARQIEGEIIMIRVEKAFRDPGKASAFAKEMQATYVEKQGQQKPVTLTTQEGQSVDCFCEIGVFDIELED
jgi:hypothetical protein